MEQLLLNGVLLSDDVGVGGAVGKSKNGRRGKSAIGIFNFVGPLLFIGINTCLSWIVTFILSGCGVDGQEQLLMRHSFEG